MIIVWDFANVKSLKQTKIQINFIRFMKLINDYKK